jgi:hypothetical protein
LRSCHEFLIVSPVSMPHKHSPDARRRRHLRAVELGFFQPVSCHAKLIAVPRALAPRVKAMADSLQIHERHNFAAGHASHFARNAALAANTAMEISATEVSQALTTHRAANRAKHAWVLPNHTSAAIELPYQNTMPMKSPSPLPPAVVERPPCLHVSVEKLSAQVHVLETKLAEMRLVLMSQAASIVAELIPHLQPQAAALVSPAATLLEVDTANIEVFGPVDFDVQLPGSAAAPAVSFIEVLLANGMVASAAVERESRRRVFLANIRIANAALARESWAELLLANAELFSLKSHTIGSEVQLVDTFEPPEATVTFAMRGVFCHPRRRRAKARLKKLKVETLVEPPLVDTFCVTPEVLEFLPCSSATIELHNRYEALSCEEPDISKELFMPWLVRHPNLAAFYGAKRLAASIASSSSGEEDEPELTLEEIMNDMDYELPC